jgi:Mn2+/Fe2+ NRAMP family transporter
MRKRILNILFWSIISAAFIGPGTITTASKAGAAFQFRLLWTLVFSMLACLVLQEAAARLTIHSGRSLGRAIRDHYHGKSGRTSMLILIAGAIIFGSAAYETGNLLGALEGLRFILFSRTPLLILAIGTIAFILLRLPSIRHIAHIMGYVVVVMGVSFVTAAILIKPDVFAILRGSFVPDIPEGAGSGILILGLIGTTVVPYNLFLGSGISEKAGTVREMRFGLSVAIIMGGLISMAVLIVGSAVNEPFTFDALVAHLRITLGYWAMILFGIGMFAAGFSSAVTAPLASAITAESLFAREEKPWGEKSLLFRSTWGLVLLTGVVLGMMGFQPIPAIILAQALNGLILPFISVLLLFVVNNVKIIGIHNLNGWISNAFLLAVVWVTLVLGVLNVSKAVIRVFPGMQVQEQVILYLNFIFSTIIWIMIFWKTIRIRRYSVRYGSS